MNSDLATSMIRTLVPVIAGFIISLFAAWGLDLGDSEPALVSFLTALFTGLYYALIRLLESRNSAFGILLGSKKTPEYGATPPPA